MCVYLRAKFEVSRIILTGLTPKKPTQIMVKFSFNRRG